MISEAERLSGYNVFSSVINAEAFMWGNYAGIIKHETEERIGHFQPHRLRKFSTVKRFFSAVLLQQRYFQVFCTWFTRRLGQFSAEQLLFFGCFVLQRFWCLFFSSFQLRILRTNLKRWTRLYTLKFFHTTCFLAGPPLHAEGLETLLQSCTVCSLPYYWVLGVGSRGAVVSAALSERKVAGSIPTIGDFHRRRM